MGNMHGKAQLEDKLNAISYETQRQVIVHLDSLRHDVLFMVSSSDSARNAQYEQERKWFDKYLRARLRH